MIQDTAISPNGLAQRRLTQVFKYLKQLHQLRNPVPRDLSGYSVVLWLDSWPIHPCIVVRKGDSAEDDIDANTKTAPPICIRRAPLTSCPNPVEMLGKKSGELLDGWLKPGWQNADAEVKVLESRNFDDEKQQAVTVAFADDPERVAALNVWSIARTKWVAAERPSIAARRLFERIHALWTTMQREGDRVELVLADGMLSVPEQSVRHPALLQRVNLEFDSSVPEFRFATGTEKVDLHRALLRLVPNIDGRMIGSFDTELEAQPIEPLGGESANGFFRRLVQALFNDGEFLSEKPTGTETARPSIWREPVIFLRPRNAGLNTTLDNIIKDLEKEETAPPVGLYRMVGVEAGDAAPLIGSGDSETSRTPAGPERDILFSKPANAEQYQIAERLAQSNAVLVQGPPGTGKTHTIANLLGYLLAQGKTVLVTAHTTKALRVLRGQVDEALQPLCLSVLEGDADSQAQLSRAAQDIAERLSGSNAASLRREAGVLRDKRQKLLEIAAALRRQLRDARFSEVEEIVLGGEGLSPIEIAKRVKSGLERDGWIPGPFQPGSLCPLTDTEVRQLYATNAAIAPSDEAQLAVSQPVLAELVSPADFRLLADERAGADLRAQAHRPDLWDDGAPAGLAAAQLQELHQRVRAAAGVLREEQHWLREVLFAGWTGGDLREAWNDLLINANTLMSESGAAQRLIMEHGPQLPASQSAGTVATLNAIVAHLEGGGALGLRTKLRHRDWHQLIDDCRVEDRVPHTLDEFRALHALGRLQENRGRFAARWRRQVEALDGPPIESVARSPERAAQSYAAEIHTRLQWRETVWEPLTDELGTVGFRWEAWLSAHPPVLGDHGELERVRLAGSESLAAIVEARAALLRQGELSAALQNQRAALGGFPQSDVAFIMVSARDSWNVENYEEAWRELARFEGLREAYNSRLALITRLEAVAPSWAHAVTHRDKPHDSARPPGDAISAWRWRQWHQELERRAAISMPELQERLDQTEQELRQLAGQIIEHETWAAQIARTGLREQQSLIGWVTVEKKITKSRRGVRDAVLMREARTLLAEARSAVPVWIMPLSRVYENFNPCETKFDVVIIDEASQADITALAALYLGREHVVVGDDKQVTPDAVGQKLMDVQALIDEMLPGIRNRQLYDGQTSIYELAATAFGGVISLWEHFRCVPEIIQFSSALCYENSIRPLREPMSTTLRPFMVSHRVNGFRGERGKTNEIEAEEIVSLVVACLDDSDYAHNDFGNPTSFGVISLLGDEQALLIENILRLRVSPDVFARHRLLCGNAAQFQGDERDVIFLSMVDGPPDDGQLAYRNAGPKDLFKKRYNVAVSRARNQLWVVHSLYPDIHLRPGDLRRRLIEHARDPQALMRVMEEQGERTDSVFEKLVLQRLISAGYRVHPQWPVGARRIDLVVEGKTKRLAIECDGEKWHTPEQLQQDLERQAILERLGWRFVRIRGSVFFRDPDTAMAPVFARLNYLGIEPLGTNTATPLAEETPLLDRIKRRAQALRGQWQAEKLATTASADAGTF